MVGDSWLAWRDDPTRGNVETDLLSRGYIVNNHARNGVSIANLFWRDHMSWETWNQINNHDMIILAIGYTQLVDTDFSSDDNIGYRNIIAKACSTARRVIAIVSPTPMPRYWEVQAAWNIINGRDILRGPDIAANAGSAPLNFHGGRCSSYIVAGGCP